MSDVPFSGPRIQKDIINAPATNPPDINCNYGVIVSCWSAIANNFIPPDQRVPGFKGTTGRLKSPGILKELEAAVAAAEGRKRGGRKRGHH